MGKMLLQRYNIFELIVSILYFFHKNTSKSQAHLQFRQERRRLGKTVLQVMQYAFFLADGEKGSVRGLAESRYRKH